MLLPQEPRSLSLGLACRVQALDELAGAGLGALLVCLFLATPSASFAPASPGRMPRLVRLLLLASAVPFGLSLTGGSHLPLLAMFVGSGDEHREREREREQ